MQNVIAYIDGFNLYYGLREMGWKWAYWLNIQALMQHFIKPDQKLVTTKYFTSIITTPKSKHKRQAAFLEALQTLPDLEIYCGHYLSNPVECQQCGYTYTAYHEKMTDVNIATELLVDAYQDGYQTAFLVTADSDLVGPLNKVHALFPEKRIIVIFPPGRSSKALIKAANGYTRINDDKLRKSLFPDKVTSTNGFILTRPARWS